MSDLGTVTNLMYLNLTPQKLLELLKNNTFLL